MCRFQGKQWLKTIGFFLGTLSLSGILVAQDAILRGTVTDPRGAVLPAVEVTLLNQASSFRRTTLTGEQGRYLFSQISPGSYELRAELPGFKVTVVRKVELRVDGALRLDLKLELGEVTESVTVSGDAVVLNTIDATLGKNFKGRQISELPLNSRNVANLLTLQPGVTAEGEVTGARRDQSNLTLDGIDVNDQQQPGAQPGLDPAAPGSPVEFQPVLRVTPDSVQQFRVTVSNPSASQGRSSGGQVSLISKAGSNEWHGSLYAYHRNTVTTANDFFNNRVDIERPVLLRNLFGGSLAGPIIPDRAFFFFNYEGRRDRSQSSVIRTVPLPHLGQGEVRYISASTGQTVTLNPADIQSLYPATAGVNPTAVAVFADAAARYPANDNGAGDEINTSGFRFNSSVPLNQNTYISKVDLNFGAHSLFLRGNYQWDRQSSAPALPDTPTPSIWSHPTGFAAGHSWLLSPSLTNTFRYGITRQAYSIQGDTSANFIAFRGVYGRSLNQTDSTRMTPAHNFTNDTSWVKGAHTIQFGTNLRIIDNKRDSFANAFDNAITNAFFYYPTDLTGGLNDLSSGSDTSFRHALAAVLGRLNQYTARFTFDAQGSLQPVGTSSARGFATEEYDFYVEDSWQIVKNLTLNLGVRYGLNTPVHETTGYQVSPTVSLGTFLERRLAGAAAGMPVNDLIEVDTSGPFYGKRGFYETDKNNFMPRISAAWSPSFSGAFLRTLFGSEGESVFRGGFAMTYDRVGSQLAVTFDSSNTLGYTSATTTAATTFNLSDHPAPRFTGFGQDIRSLPEVTIPGRLTFPLTKPADNARRIEGALDDTIQTPVNYSWNFSIGREFPGGWFIEASYLGRKARSLFATRDIMHPNDIVDPASGQSFYDAARILLDARKADTPITQIAPIPFIENFFPNVQNSGARFIDPGLTPTQNAFLWTARDGWDIVDWTFFQDAWNNLGILENLFFHPQYAAFMAFGSLAESDYHGFTLTAQERFRESLSLDFNYTWSKSFDTASGLQSSSLTGAAALIKNPIHPEYEYSVSNFDTNHIVNANWLYSLPFGQGRKYGAGMPGAVDSILGGWSINGVFRWNSGRPVRSPIEVGRWNTNWQISNSAVRIRDPRPAPSKNGSQPNFWADSQYAYNSFRDTYAGEVGDRNVFRRSDYFAIDLGLHKSFRMPYDDRHSLVFRWEVFNLTNTQTLGPPSNLGIGIDPEISLQTPNFGIITAIQGAPRVMQFGVRFEF